jgi:hypothetical protein
MDTSWILHGYFMDTSWKRYDKPTNVMEIKPIRKLVNNEKNLYLPKRCPSHHWQRRKAIKEHCTRN